MGKLKLWKIILVAVVFLFCILFLLPSLAPEGSLPKWYLSVFSRKLNYGLDLRGGLELRYTVDYKKAISDNLLKMRFSIEDEIIKSLAMNDKKEFDKLSEEEKNRYRKLFDIERTEFDTLQIEFKDKKNVDIINVELVRSIDPEMLRLPPQENKISLKLSDRRVREIRDSVVSQTLDTIRKRVEAFGLVEPDVRKSGDTDITIQLPGVSKEQMEMVRERIGQTAHLALRLIDRSDEGKMFFKNNEEKLKEFKEKNPEKGKSLEIGLDPTTTQWYLKGENKRELLTFLKTIKIPDDRFVGFELVEKKEQNIVKEKFYRTYYLFAKEGVSGDNLTRAAVFFESTGEPYVSIEFDSKGTKDFAQLTTENVGEYLAIMLDDEVNSAPVIKEPITGGRAKITLGGARHPREILGEAQALVTVLTHGAYKAPVHKAHDYEVGPSLGKDTIKAGTTSFIVGSIAVVVFMIIYYEVAGLIANLAFILNILIVLVVLIGFNAALTMPGIAGIVLTVGMAVDANVIITERIREELRVGKNLRAAVDTGYQRAFWTVFDANLTTALAAVILLNYTSGPIYGFAVTLLIGIISSFITAVYITRMVFEYLIEWRKVKNIRIGMR